MSWVIRCRREVIAIPPDVKPKAIRRYRHMEPSRQQVVRSDQNGWGTTLRGALRSTHIIERDTEAPPTFAARCHSAPCAWMLTPLCRRGRLAADHPANARSSRPVRIVAYGHHALSCADSQE